MLVLFDDIIRRYGSSENSVFFPVSENVEVVFDTEIYILYTFICPSLFGSYFVYRIFVGQLDIVKYMIRAFADGKASVTSLSG